MFLITPFLLASITALANGNVIGQPYQVTLVRDKFKGNNSPWTADLNGGYLNPSGALSNDKYAKFIPDGSTWAFRTQRNNSNSPMIFGLNYDFRMQGPTQYIKDANVAAGANVSAYSQSPLYKHQHGNFVTLNQTISTPPANITGLRGTGDLYDGSSLWLKNVFRLSETSLYNNVSDDFLIGFSHNEDYPKDKNGSGCSTWKSIGVRYSNDSGLSWTRSVPIITRGIEPAEGIPGPDCKMGGTGDFAAMWNKVKQQWQIFTSEMYREWNKDHWNYQENRLVLAVSSDAYAAPYTWSRIEPVSNKAPRPGFETSDDFPMKHGNLDSVPGESPTIIYCNATGLWHMMYARWKGGLVYTNSSDGYIWKAPVNVTLNYPEVKYPSLIGNMGDTLTTDTKATLYFKTSLDAGDGWRDIRAVDVQFPW